jgi:CDP-4-dehydro-6-deoxyglucose reductase
VDQPDDLAGLSDSDKAAGFVLTCCAKPSSDLELEADYHPELAEIKKATVPCKVDSIEFPADDVAVLKLRFPPAILFKYLPGQYIELIYNGLRRSYSIANFQAVSDGIELHIRRVPDGKFSEQVFAPLQSNELLRMEGPLGTFFVRKGKAPLIFLAGGTGFAPVKAMVEQLISEGSDREIHMYWGAQTVSGFYSDLALNWASKYSNIHYTPVLSGRDLTWEGRTGYVHRAVMEDFSGLSRYEVYACGSPIMIDAARSDFEKQGLHERSFYSDSFVPSA